MAEICKYGIAKTELVLICDCDRSGDHNCHWHWDAGDQAKSWQVDVSFLFTHALFHYSTVRSFQNTMCHLSFTASQSCVQHEGIIITLLNLFIF